MKKIYSRRRRHRKHKSRKYKKHAGMMEDSPEGSPQMPLPNPVTTMLRDLQANINLEDYPFVSRRDFNKALRMVANAHQDEFSISGYASYGMNYVIGKSKKQLNKFNLLLRAEKNNQDRANQRYVSMQVLSDKSRLYNQILPYDNILNYLG